MNPLVHHVNTGASSYDDEDGISASSYDDEDGISASSYDDEDGIRTLNTI